MTTPPERIPILIVAGFLGTGKTTFIRDLLPRLAAGPRAPYVILNDFLNAAIDGFTLKGLGAEIKTLAAGCVCCEDPASLVNAILNVPESIRPIIILEANGATDPYSLIETITLTPDLRHIISSVLQVTIINEARWGKRWIPGDKQTERAQVSTASAILTNRGDRASEQQKKRLAADLEKLNPTAPRLDAEAFIDLLLQETAATTLPAPSTINPIPHAHHHIAVQLEVPLMTEDRLRTWLLALPREILRIKGLTWISETEMAYFNRTDDPLESPRIIKATPRDGMKPAAVFIGPGVQEETIRASFSSTSHAPSAFKLTL